MKATEPQRPVQSLRTGLPCEVLLFHGTRRPFEGFNTDWVHFADCRELSQHYAGTGGVILEISLCFKNPLVLDGQGGGSLSIPATPTINALFERLNLNPRAYLQESNPDVHDALTLGQVAKLLGHDGLLVQNLVEGAHRFTECVASKDVIHNHFTARWLATA